MRVKYLGYCGNLKKKINLYIMTTLIYVYVVFSSYSLKWIARLFVIEVHIFDGFNKFTNYEFRLILVK